MPVADVVTAIEQHMERREDIILARDYDEGRHRYTFASATFLRKYKWVIENSRENLCPAVIRAFSDGVSIAGWTGAGMDEATETFHDRALGLVKVQNLVNRETFRTGDAYALVWPNAREEDRVWYHRADQAVPMADPDDPSRLLWVAKLWTSRGHGRVNVYYADRVERWITASPVLVDAAKHLPQWPTDPTAWQPFTYDDEGETLANPYERVPWAWWTYDATEQGGHGRSILRDVIPLQDALNKSVADLIVAEEAISNPLRAILNYEAKQKINPRSGEVEEERIEFDETRNRLLGIPGEGPLVQLDAVDPSGLLQVQDAFALKIARTLGIPAYYFTEMSGDVPSGESLRVLSARRTAALRDFQQDATGPWQDIMGLLGIEETEPVWSDVAPQTEQERQEGAKVRQDLGYPLEETMRFLGEDEETRLRVHEERAKEERAQAAAARESLEAWRRGEDPARVLR